MDHGRVGGGPVYGMNVSSVRPAVGYKLLFPATCQMILPQIRVELSDLFPPVTDNDYGRDREDRRLLDILDANEQRFGELD